MASTTTRRPERRADIAIAVLRRGERVLVRKRRPGEHLAGVWEFPGGKIDEGEEAEDAARREAREELGVECGDLALREVIEHAYEDRAVRLFVFEGDCSGEPAAPDGAEWAWLTPGELAKRPIPEANRALVARMAAAAARP